MEPGRPRVARRPEEVTSERRGRGELMLARWKPWLIGAAGVILGLIFGMILGRNATVEMNEWLQGVGSLVAAITTSIAVVFAARAYWHERQVHSEQQVAAVSARLDAELRSARGVEVSID